MGKRTRAGRATAVAMLLASSACARPAAPPGGPPDARPPVVVGTTPDPFDDVPAFEGPVRLVFDERISEQPSGGSLQELVEVSPRTGEVRVSHERRALTIQVGGGFLPGVVYRVTLMPGVQDMFGNALRDPFELVFTTGAVADPTTVAGEVWDRVTGAAMAGATVQAAGPDSLPYVGAADTEGIYALRYLPAGPYRLVAFDDVNRNGTLDPNEPRGGTEVRLQPADTVFENVPVLAPDSTAPVLQGAQALDSVTVVLTFDDYLDPAAPVGDAEVALRSDSVEAPGVAERYHEPAYTAFVQAVTDSLLRLEAEEPGGEEPDTILGDTLGVPPDSVPPPDTLIVGDTLPPPPPLAPAPVQAIPRGPTPLPDARQGGMESRGRVLPGRRMVLVLEAPLAPGAPYEVTADGLVNINGLGGGGGTVAFTAPAADTAAVEPPE